MIFEIYRKLQLFSFAFMLAVAGLIGAGIMAGNFDRTQIQAEIAGRAAGYAFRNRELIEATLAVMGRDVVLRDPANVAGTTGEQGDPGLAPERSARPGRSQDLRDGHFIRP